jgi:hypothetical protein
VSSTRANEEQGIKDAYKAAVDKINSEAGEITQVAKKKAVEEDKRELRLAEVTHRPPADLVFVAGA